jgi:hypothetical protein
MGVCVYVLRACMTCTHLTFVEHDAHMKYFPRISYSIYLDFHIEYYARTFTEYYARNFMRRSRTWQFSRTDMHDKLTCLSESI